MKSSAFYLKKYLALLVNIVLLLGLHFFNPVWAACEYVSYLTPAGWYYDHNPPYHSNLAACQAAHGGGNNVSQQPVNVPVYTYTVKTQIVGGEGCIREVGSNDCQSSHTYENVEQDTPFMFQVTPNEGYTFSEWTGDCKGRSAGLATMTTTTYNVEEFGEKVFVCTAVLEEKKTSIPIIEIPPEPPILPEPPVLPEPTAKKDQTIQFDNIADQTADNSDISLGAQTTSGLLVNLSLDSTSSGCELSGNTVKSVAKGVCVIHANQAGNEEYKPAPTVTQRFNIAENPINKQEQTITFNPLSELTNVYLGVDFT